MRRRDFRGPDRGADTCRSPLLPTSLTAITNVLLHTEQSTYCIQNLQYCIYNKCRHSNTNNRIQIRSLNLSFTNQSWSHLSVRICHPTVRSANQYKKLGNFKKMLDRFTVSSVSEKSPAYLSSPSQRLYR